MCEHTCVCAYVFAYVYVHVCVWAGFKLQIQLLHRQSAIYSIYFFSNGF